MPEYFIVLVVIFLVTVVLHQYFNIRLYQSTAQMIVFNLIILAVGTTWDQFAIARGHWSFGERFLLGPKIGFMPIEEFIFVLVMGHFGITLYKIFEVKFR